MADQPLSCINEPKAKNDYWISLLKGLFLRKSQTFHELEKADVSLPAYFKVENSSF